MKYAIAYTDINGDRRLAEGDSVYECVIRVGFIEMDPPAYGKTQLSFKMQGYNKLPGPTYNIAEKRNATACSLREACVDFSKIVLNHLVVNHCGSLYQIKKPV